jgi:transcriptional regulator with XRE-family HTH domain
MNKALRIAIIDRGLKQYEVAKRIGVGEARMSGFVHERFEPTDEEKKRIARVLKASVEDLFQAEEAEAAAS